MKYKEKFRENAYEILSNMKRVNMIFFICIFILMGVFWYYISVFCVVKYNSRINWLVGSIITFAITNIIPFISSVLIAGFRFIGLKVFWLDGLYKLSQCIEKCDTFVYYK